MKVKTFDPYFYIRFLSASLHANFGGGAALPWRKGPGMQTLQPQGIACWQQEAVHVHEWGSASYSADVMEEARALALRLTRID